MFMTIIERLTQAFAILIAATLVTSAAWLLVQALHLAVGP